MVRYYYYYKLLTAQNPKAIVAMTPPNEKMRIGASPPSRVVPTLSPTFLAYRRRGPEHCGQRNPGPCSSKYIPAHSACDNKQKVGEKAARNISSNQQYPPGCKCIHNQRRPIHPASTFPHFLLPERRPISCFQKR